MKLTLCLGSLAVLLVASIGYADNCSRGYRCVIKGKASEFFEGDTSAKCKANCAKGQCLHEQNYICDIEDACQKGDAKACETVKGMEED